MPSGQRTALGALLRRLADDDRTVLITTHDESFAREWSTVLRARDGKVAVS